MRDLKDRLVEFIQSLGITSAEFERSANISNGTVARASNNMRKSTLKMIADAYPQLNMDWVVNERGSMIQDVKGDNNKLNQEQNSNPRLTKEFDRALMTIDKALNEVAEQRKLTAKAQSQIDELISLLREKK